MSGGTRFEKLASSSDFTHDYDNNLAAFQVGIQRNYHNNGQAYYCVHESTNYISPHCCQAQLKNLGH